VSRLFPEESPLLGPVISVRRAVAVPCDTHAQRVVQARVVVVEHLRDGTRALIVLSSLVDGRGW